jgi:uncharacterized membrane protein (UPF0127 family)
MDRVGDLDIDGIASGLRVGIASHWWSRTRGLWPGTRWPPFEVLQLPRCRAVHTFGMRVALDVVFSDADGRVTSVRHGLRPWRIARDPRACCTWEMRAGMARRLDLRTGTRLRARGATIVEFLLAAVLVVIPLTLVVLEVAQLANARHLLQHAVTEAARQATVAEFSDLAIRRSLGYGLLPLFVPLDARAAFGDAADLASRARVSADRGLEAWARAALESARPDLSEIDLEPLEAEGRAWRLRVRYCREMYFPLARDVIAEIARLGTASLFDQACLARRRLPLEAWSVVLRPGRAARAAEGLPQLPPSEPGWLPELPPAPGSDGGGGGGGGGGDVDQQH